MTELIEIVETARALPMSTSCVLPRERVLDLLDELREVLPPEMDEARAEAERYATKLTVEAEDYAERTLDELSAVLHRAAATADQGRSALAQRRADAWVDALPGAPSEPPADGADAARKPPISA